MIDKLALAAGIAPSYSDYFGKERSVSTETKRAILNAMGYDVHNERDAARVLHDLERERSAREFERAYVVPADERVDLPFFAGTLSPGYYRHDTGGKTITIAAVPRQAYVPPALEAAQSWGFALQLYSIRSQRNWGIGDFGDLARFARLARDLGAQTIALNPLHQLHLEDPARASPYSPLSRLHLNAMYIDVEAASGTLGIPVGKPDVLALRDAALVDYRGVAYAKLPALRALYDRFRMQADSPHTAEFRAFRDASGTPLRSMAIYESLNARFKSGWLDWPAAYRHPHSGAVDAYARSNAQDVEFYEFLQWLADMQLAHAAACASGMSIGLYRDLAIGVDTQSADVWADRNAFCLGISAGAPPDALNAIGQNWGLPPMNPRVLRERAYAPFIGVLRANMRHAGALRIDHVMGLMRLFVIPDGAPPSDGAYITYPFEEMAGILALESASSRCMVVGEDLGTLPPGFRERMAERRFFSCRLLYFERDDRRFCDPAIYPHDAVASTGTHDLPPLAGFVAAMGAQDRADLFDLLGDPAPADDVEIVKAAYRVLAHAGAALLLLQMEDALVQREAVNVPGTTTEAPNWRRKLPVSIEKLQDDPRFATIVTVLQELRSRARIE